MFDGPFAALPKEYVTSQDLIEIIALKGCFTIGGQKYISEFIPQFNRTIQLPANHSFFLFGARGVGKTSLLEGESGVNFIDLLDSRQFDEFSRHPVRLSEYIERLPTGRQWVVIDEVQRVPEILNMVHLEIEDHSRSRMGVGKERPVDRELCFALTGSSARKLKRGKANLLAGRAFLYHLHPLTHCEIPTNISVEDVVAWGTLPLILNASNDEEKKELLFAYVHSYLREEILEEQIARSAPPFRRFLEVAAQMNGQIVNFSAVGRDAGVSTPTAQNYFQILEDTLLAFRLDPFHESFRKRQRGGPKYYFSISAFSAYYLAHSIRP